MKFTWSRIMLMMRLRVMRNVIVHPAAKPLHSAYLGEPFLQRAGTRWAQSLRARFGQNARVVVNGGNCDWPDINWVHYVHAAYERQSEGSALRRARMRLAHQRSLAGERRALERARSIIANSNRTKRDLIERLDIAPSESA